MRRAAAGLVAAVLAALAVASCGGERASAPRAAEARPAPAAAKAALDPQLVAALGDSITAGSPLWDPDPAFRAQISAPTGKAPDPRSQWEYWFERSDPRKRKVRNCGVFGERTDGIAARLEQCAEGAATVVVQGGINDIAQGRSVADAARTLERTVQLVQASGRRAALVEVLPWNNGYPDAAPLITDLNRRIRAIGERRRVSVFRWYGALEDPAAPGRMRDDLTIDGDHPSVAGYQRLAALVKLP